MEKAPKRTRKSTQMTGQALLDDLRGLHFATLGITALERVFTKLSQLTESCINWWLGEECPSAKAERVLKGTNDKILEWLKEIELLNEEEALHMALTDVMYHNRFYKLMDDANDFLRYCVENRVPPVVFTIVKEGRKQAQDLIKRLSEIRPQHGFRYSPFVVCLAGDSGTGKSNMMHRIRKIIQKNLGAPNYNLVHAMATGEEKFVSGYEGQTIIEWDDTAQNTNQDSLLAQFINWVSNADVRMNMADVPHKGMFFQSKAIIQSTNVAFVKINSIRDMEAYNRRRHLVIVCKFANGWTQERVEALEEPDPHFRFIKFRFCNPKKEDDWITYDLTFDQVLERINRKHMRHHRKQLRLIEEYMQLEGSMRIPRGVQPIEVLDEDEEELEREEEARAARWRQHAELVNNATDSEAEEDDDGRQMETQMWNDSDDEEYELAHSRIDEIRQEIDPSTQEYSDKVAEQLALFLWETLPMQRKKFIQRLENQRNTIIASLKKDNGIVRKCIECMKNTWNEFKKKAKAFYEQYPTFLKVVGIVGSLAVLIPIVAYMLSKEGESESAYDAGPKVKPRLTKAEIDSAIHINRSENAYDSGPKCRLPRLMRAEGLDLTENDLEKIRQKLDMDEPYDDSTQRELYAICIPSGEGKTTLCQKYPDIFVDADEKIMFGPVVRPKTAIIGVLACLGMACGHSPWERFARFYRKHQPHSNRILLTHHPSFTDRKILASYMLPSATNIRANLMGRGALGEIDHHVMTYDDREKHIFSMIKDLEQPKMKSEGTTDVDAVNLARNKIHPALSTFGWLKGNNELSGILQGMYIGGKILLVPHHFFRDKLEGEQFCIFRGTTRIIVEYVPERMIRIRDKDAVLYFAGSRLPSRSSLLKYFVAEKDLEKISTVDALLAGVSLDGVTMEKSVVARGRTTQHYDDDAYIQYGWTYKAHTLPGECGSMLVACSRQLPAPAKIVGMHTAGFSDRIGGFSVLLTREMIDEAAVYLENRFGKNVIGLPIAPEVMVKQEAVETLKIIPEGNFAIFGAMPGNLSPAQPQKTSLRPTPFQGEEFEVKKKPAHLKQFNGISPLKNALKKYGKVTYPFSARDIEIVKQDMIMELRHKLTPRFGKRIATEEEAIFGIDGLDYVDKMNFKTSAGWPYQCINPSKHGKAYLFDLEQRRISDMELRQRLDQRLAFAEKGERVPSIWRDCLKDELRPLEKVDAGKTRLFTIAPVDFTILVRRYFLGFEEAFYRNNCTFFSAVGINPESFEWTSMWQYMREYGDECFAGDFETFDGTLMAELMAAACDVINAWYDDGPFKALVRRVLIDEMIHTVQLVNNCVYGTLQGNPSGNPLTVIINTMVNIMYMRLAWRRLAPPNLRSMICYHQNVREMAYGDDNFLVVKRAVQDFFNQVTVSAFLKEHGIGYTDESKTGELIAIRKLDDITFLKRGFRKDPEFGSNVVLPTMSVDTITSLCDWYRVAPDVDEQIRTNILCALSFAFYHGREFYSNFKGKCDVMLGRHQIQPVSVAFEEWQEAFQATMTGHLKTTTPIDF